MLVIKAIGSTEVAAYKTTRLNALRDAPTAFSSTYAREQQFCEAEWKQRVDNFCTPQSVGYLAMDGDATCGIAGCFVDSADPQQALLVSMWVDPRFRRLGVGKKLIDEVSNWAKRNNVTRLNLMVTENNGAAISFYQRLGFVMTGASELYPNDPTLREFSMVKFLA